MKTTLLALSLLCGICLAQAQTDNSAARPRGNGRITGMVMDSASRQPVSFATVALVLPATDKPVSGAVCDDKGQFEMTKVPAGEYQLAITFLGYRTLKTVPFTIAERGTELNLGALLMSAQVQRLKEVEVVGQRNLIEEKVDRTVYNAENDQTTKGGDATDVLRRVPMLSVDLDGNPSMRGNQNIRVLINNKPSTIVSSSIADALKQIPADQIKSVEVITSPSAKYDAEGSAGIINIITKKNNLQGFSLGVDGSAGLRGSNLGLNGSYRRGKMGFSLGGFGRSNYNVTGDFENWQLTRGTDANGAPIQLLNTQRASTLNQGLFGRYTLGWDYDINKYNSLAASVQYGVRNGRNYQNGLLTETFLNNSPTGRNTRDVSVTDLSGTVDVNLTYTRTFEKPQKEFSILALYSRNNRTNNFLNDILSSDNPNAFDLKNINQSYNQEATLQLDYQTPIGDKQILEFGGKDIMRNVSSDFEYLIANGPGGAFVASSDAQLSNTLDYDQNVASGYVSYTLSLPKSYTVKAGGRYEYTTILARLQDNKDINIPSYGVLVPSINVSKKLKNGNTLKASYNRRIQRPSLQFLNPNPQNANPLNVTIGNPELQPEFTNNFELGYNASVKSTSLNFSAFARNTNNALQSVRDIIGRDTIRTTFQNIGREDAYGGSVFVSINVSNKFSLNGGGDAFYAVLKNNVPDPLYNASNQGWVYSFRAFGNYTLTKGWGLQLFSFYRGRQVQLQGVQGGFGIYSLSLRKEFKNKKGSIGFGAENFLTSPIRIRNELNSPVISQTSVNSQNNINFKINFSYRIGKMTVDGGPKRRRSIKNDDMKEGGDGGGNDGGGQQGGAPGGQAPAGGRRPAQGAYPAKRPASADSTRLRKDSLPADLDSLQFKSDSSQSKRDSTGLTPTERSSTDESPQPIGSPQPLSPGKAPAQYPQKPQPATPPAGNAPKKP